MAARRAALAFIFVTVALDMLALGLVIPVLPRLVLEFTGGDTVRSAELFGLFGTAWALMQFFFSPLFGAVSDRFGRRPVILMSNLCLGLDYLLMALAPNLAWLFVGRVISGIASASVSTAFAYIADSTPPEERARGFGLVGVAFGLGFVLGPALGGLLGSVAPRLPFWVAAGCSLLNALYGLLILPESLPPERRAAVEWRRANPLGSLGLLRAHRGLAGLAGASFLGQLAHAVLPSVFVLYATYRYGWDERAIGLTLAGVGISSAVVQGLLVGRAVKRLGERRALLLGLACGAIGFAIYGWAPSGALFCLGVPIMAIWGFSGPAAQALMTARVDPTEQGRLQGANGSLGGIAELIGPGLFTLTFAQAITTGSGVTLPGAPFYLAGLLLLAAMAVAAKATRP